MKKGKTKIGGGRNDPGPANPVVDTSIPSRHDDVIETYVVIPPDGGYGWIVVLASFLCQFLTDGSMYTFGIFLEEISIALNCAQTQITLSSSIQNGCYNMSGPIVCALTNRFGFRIVCITGAILTALAYSAASFVETVPLFILAHGFVGGIGFGMIYMPSIIIIGFYFEKWRALATSLIVTGSAIGTIAFPPIFNILLKDCDWRMKFRIISAIALILILCGATYRQVKQTRIVRQTVSGPITKMGMYAIASTISSLPAVREVYSRNTNLAYPTTAEVHRQGNYSIYDPSPTSSEIVITNSGTSIKTTKTGVSMFSKGGVSETERLETILEEDFHLTKCQICCIKCRHSCVQRKCCRRKHNIPFRPMYRDDVFLVSSVAAVSQYSTKPARDKKLDYHMSVTRVMTQRDFNEEYIPCVCCPHSVRRTLATMFDFSIIRTPSFVLLVISGFMSTLGIYIPYLYVVDAARLEGDMHPHTAVLLMTVLGIANATGRLACGLLSFFPKIKPLEFSMVALLFAGIATCCSTISYAVPWQFSYVIIYGTGLAIASATRPLIIIELVGLHKLSNAFGLQALFQGIACLIGVPLASFVLEISKMYIIPFNLAGATIMLAAIFLGFVRIALNKQKLRNQS